MNGVQTNGRPRTSFPIEPVRFYAPLGASQLLGTHFHLSTLSRLGRVNMQMNPIANPILLSQVERFGIICAKFNKPKSRSIMNDGRVASWEPLPSTGPISKLCSIWTVVGLACQHMSQNSVHLWLHTMAIDISVNLRIRVSSSTLDDCHQT